MGITRREFLKYAGGGVAGLVVGDKLAWLLGTPAHAAVATVRLRITDAMKEMVTHNAINDARCYFWIYKSDQPDLPAECPGPNIFATQGQLIPIEITNNLDEPHSFAIPEIGFTTGPIAPGDTYPGLIDTSAAEAGAYLYYDSLNEPVNRVMGLHGALVLMPAAAAPGHKATPYTNPTASVQALFDDLGGPPVDAFGKRRPWPGLAWGEGDDTPASFAPPYRQYIWVLHQASPNLFAAVGRNETISFTTAKGEAVSGSARDPVVFTKAFLHDAFSLVRANFVPQYFTINGQSGHFAHNNPFICPNLRCGEPTLIRCLNAGLMTHSMHIHANHMFMISIRGQVQDNPFWVDTFTSDPLGRWDWLHPYMKPPDVPNARGIGLADEPLTTLMGGKTWPPTEELGLFFPEQGAMAGSVPIHVQLSPMCFPMHDHSEPSQTAQGGNYNCGLISGTNFTGDRNQPGGVVTFPNAPTLFGPMETGPAAGPEDAGM